MARATGALEGLALAVGAVTGWWTVRERRLGGYHLAGKTVLVTGGSRGLGFLLAREFLRRGAQVAICARNREGLRRAADLLASEGGRLEVFRCDVSQQAEVRRLAREVQAKLGPVDVLVNNAGLIQVGPMATMTLEDYEESLGVHFWGPLYLTMELLPEMRERGEGRIVNITSIAARIPAPHLLPYTAGKFALLGLSEGLRAELSRTGVRVTTVVPGLMRTGSPRNALFKGHRRAEYAWFALTAALPPASMSAERAARAIVRACERGRAELVLSTPAKLASRLAVLFPGLTQAALGLLERVLPSEGGAGTQRAPGHQSESQVAPSPLTTLNDRAAERYNEQLH